MRLLSVDARVAGRDRGALAALIESSGADVAAVHNGPHLLRWRSISAAIGRRCGLVVVGGGRPAGANLLLSSLGIDELGARDVGLAGGSALHPAGAATGLLRSGGSTFVLAAATILGSAAARVAQVGRVQRTIAELSPDAAPAILCVQGAEPQRTAAWEALARDRVVAAGRIFLDPRITVVEVRDLDGHAGAAVPPVVLDLELP